MSLKNRKVKIMFKRFFSFFWFLNQMYLGLFLQVAVTEDVIQGPTLAGFSLLWMKAGFKKE